MSVVRHTQHFHPDSDKMLKCPCCGKGELSVATFIVLEVVRAYFRKPVVVTSGCRCTKYNRVAGSKTDLSRHVCDSDWEPDAVDIVVKGVEPREVYKFLCNLPFANLLGIGNYESFTHVDTRGVKARW